MNSTAIESIHTNIAQVIKRHIGYSVEFRSERAVEYALVGDTFSFVLVPSDYRRPWDSVRRKRGPDCPAIQLIEVPEFEDTVWAGWYEEWKKIAHDEFELRGLSWTFFWGIHGRDKVQLLRAEWDAPSSGRGSVNAPQPHWHVDTDFMLTSFRRVKRRLYVSDSAEVTPQTLSTIDASGEPSALEELEPTIGALEEIDAVEVLEDLTLESVHLGMGGWTENAEYPGCWQRPIPANWREIVVWVERILRHVMEQFSLIRSDTA